MIIVGAFAVYAITVGVALEITPKATDIEQQMMKFLVCALWPAAIAAYVVWFLPARGASIATKRLRARLKRAKLPTATTVERNNR